MSESNLKLYLIILFSVIACNAPTEGEIRAIATLNDRYPNYRFSPGSDPFGTQLNLYMRSNSWDSLALKVLYDSSITTYYDRGMPWVYLVVHDSTDKYQFTIVKYSADRFVFFREQ
jgi:hypothetical protein